MMHRGTGAGPRAGAVEVGFEPTEPVKAHALSRRARSAASVLHLGHYRGALQGLDPAPPGPEELLDDGGALVPEDAGGQVALVVQAGVLHDVVERVGGPRLLVGGAVDDAANPRRHQRPRAHRSRNEG